MLNSKLSNLGKLPPHPLPPQKKRKQKERRRSKEEQQKTRGKNSPQIPSKTHPETFNFSVFTYVDSYFIESKCFAQTDIFSLLVTEPLLEEEFHTRSLAHETWSVSWLIEHLLLVCYIYVFIYLLAFSAVWWKCQQNRIVFKLCAGASEKTELQKEIVRLMKENDGTVYDCLILIKIMPPVVSRVYM